MNSKIIKTFATTSLVTMLLTNGVFASTFVDVPSSHWAYKNIDSVSNKGLMVGDLSGTFRPNSYIDRFETSRVLARMLGYKTTGASSEDQKYFNEAYEKNKSLLDQYDQKFSKWDATANREIAFLLEKGVLTNDDLNKFVLTQTSGEETRYVLTREDIAVFLVRELDAVQKAESFSYTNPFLDDARIDSSKKHSVYYLRSIGIVNGDNKGNYNPKNAITRAEMTSLLDKTYSYMYGGQTDPNTTTVTTVTGVIDVYYDNLNTVQVKTYSGETGIYVIADNASITVDGFLRTKSDLKAGMNITGVVSDGKNLVDIKATTTTTTTPNTGTTIVTPSENAFTGTVGSVNATDSQVGIQTKTISPKGEVSTITQVFTVTPNTSITRDGKAVGVQNITVGDIITCEVNGQYISNIQIELKDQQINGTITKKGTDVEANRNYYEIEKADGTKTKVYVGADSVINRGGVSNVGWGAVKVGDTVSCTSTFGVINSLVATGVRKQDSGYVSSVVIAQNNGSVTLVDSATTNTNPRTYSLNPDVSNAYDLKIGSKVKLVLESNEVSGITITSEASKKPTNGDVQDVYRDYIFVLDDNGNSQTIYYDGSTKFINSATGGFTNVGKINYGDRVYAVYGDNDTNIATTITIVKK